MLDGGRGKCTAMLDGGKSTCMVVLGDKAKRRLGQLRLVTQHMHAIAAAAKVGQKAGAC